MIDRSEKDAWDRLEIVGKVALPIVVAGATIWFNSQVSQRQQSAEMTRIAVGVLSEADISEDDPLRDWAVNILVDQGGLSLAAARQLRNEPLATPFVIYGPIRTKDSPMQVCLELVAHGSNGDAQKRQLIEDCLKDFGVTLEFIEGAQ
ncbi:MAG: hypothetical protein AAF665_11155 [Pseudomonadota bacterium]